MSHFRFASLVPLLAPTSLTWGQSFAVRVDYPAHSGTQETLARSLVAPLAQEGNGSIAALSQDEGIVKAAKRLASGFRDTTQVDFVAGNGGQAVRYRVPSLNGGESSEDAIFHSPSVYMRRQGDTITIEDRPLGYDLYDNPVVRFVMLGTPLPGAPGASPERGKVRFQSSPTMIRVVEWNTDKAGRLAITSKIESDHRLVPMLRASVAADRSEGWLERVGNPGTAPTRSTFRRLKGVPAPFDFARSFPRGLPVLDYRGGRDNPLKYEWTGNLEAEAKTVPDNTAVTRLGGAGVGVALLALGVRRRRIRSSATNG